MIGLVVDVDRYHLNEFVIRYRKLVEAGFEPVIVNPTGDRQSSPGGPMRDAPTLHFNNVNGFDGRLKNGRDPSQGSPQTSWLASND